MYTSLVNALRRQPAASLLIAAVLDVILHKVLAGPLGDVSALWISIVLLLAFALWVLWRWINDQMTGVFVIVIATVMLFIFLSGLTTAFDLVILGLVVLAGAVVIVFSRVLTLKLTR